MEMRVAVLIPCYNEEKTIGKVVADFRRELPNADIYVFNNNSADRTVEAAERAGAIVQHEYRQGKGNVVRTMFEQVDADIYVMVDGDDTYEASCVHEMIRLVQEGRADMVAGDRISSGQYAEENKRTAHNFGNNLVKSLINLLFHADIKDVMTGYRAMNRQFVKNCPIICKGFEIETSVTLHALDKNFLIRHVPINYRDRPEGSTSKLNTIRDGFRVLLTILNVFKNYRPLLFFSMLALLFFLLGLASGMAPVVEFIRTGLVTRLPLAVLATGLMILSSLSLACGFILDTIVKNNKESYAIRLMNFIDSNERCRIYGK